MSKKAIIFDLDGTLVNTYEDIAISVNEALAYFSLPLHTNEEIRAMIGKGSKNLITQALPSERREEAFINAVHEYYVGYYDEHLLVKTHVYDGLKEVIEKLRFEGRMLAVLSNKDDGQVKRIISELLPNVFFVCNGFSPNYPHKPAPDSTLAIMKELGVTAEETAFVGDSAIDVATAKNAGVLSVGVTWGFGGEGSFESNYPDVLVTSPKQLLEI